MDQPDTESLSRPVATPATHRAAAHDRYKDLAGAPAERHAISWTPAKGSMSGMTAKRSMNFSEAVTIATSSLWAHKLRSVLTLLGVVIGVAAVIAVVSLINGANQYVATRVFRLG